MGGREAGGEDIVGWLERERGRRKKEKEGI